MSTERDAELNTALIDGREHRPIVVVEYDEQWPARYRAMATRIVQAFSPTTLTVERIGSTAVPGLAAKPIVDYADAKSKVVQTILKRAHEWRASTAHSLPTPH